VSRNDEEVPVNELIAFAGRSLAAYKRPRLVRFVDDLPKTSTGKIMRRELSREFQP
jgi:long-chain acyl-CoA synthetase